MSAAVLPHQPVSGVWTSPDGRVSLQLRADGRFVETRVVPANVVTGAYILVGEALKLFDDHGAVVSGTLVGGRLRLGTA